MRVVADSFRPLEGITSAITSTITAGVNTTGVAAPVLWSANAGKWRYAGCVPVQLTGDPSACVNDNNTFGNAFNFQPITIEMNCNATDLRIYFYGFNKPDVSVIVDGMRITTGFIHANVADGAMTWKLTQPTARMRSWRLQIMGGFVQIATSAGATMTPTAPSESQLGVVGDSYASGGILTKNAVAPGTAGTISCGAPFGEFEQITRTDTWRCAIPGTGYVANAGLGTAAPYGSPQRVAKVAAMPDLDVLVLFGSVNDRPHPIPTIVAAANAAWTAYKAAQPNAQLIVVGLECYGTADATLDAINAALKAAALAHPAVDTFVDLRADSFMTGTGYDGHPQYDGNSDVFLADEDPVGGTHLTHLGARFWGEQLAEILGAIAISGAGSANLPWFIVTGNYRGVVPDTLDVGLAPDEYLPWGEVTLTPHVFTTATNTVERASTELRLTELEPPVTVIVTPIRARIETGVLRLPRLNAPPNQTPPTQDEIEEQLDAQGVPMLANSEALELGAGRELVWRVDFGPVTILGAQYSYRGFYFRPPTITPAAFAEHAWEPPELDLTTVARLTPAA